MTNVRLSDDRRDRIDAVRGDVPRQRWVDRAIDGALGDDSIGRALDAGRLDPQSAAALRAGTVLSPSDMQPLPKPPAFDARQANMDRQARLNKAKGM